MLHIHDPGCIHHRYPVLLVPVNRRTRVHGSPIFCNVVRELCTRTEEKDEIDRLEIVWKSFRYVLEIKEWKIVTCLGIQLRCITIDATWAEVAAITSRLKALIEHASCTRSYHANT